MTVQSCCPGCAHDEAYAHADVATCAMSEPAAIHGCHTCAHCVVHGYRPVRKIMTISYACDVKPGYVYPSDEECDMWEQGDPWERARRDWGERYGR